MADLAPIQTNTSKVLGHEGGGISNLDTLTRAGRRGFPIWMLDPEHEAKTLQKTTNSSRPSLAKIWRR